MSIDVKICVNDNEWRSATFQPTSMVREIHPSAILIWNNHKRIYDVTSGGAGPDSTFLELGIASKSILYVFTTDFPCPSGDLRSIVPLAVQKIQKFAEDASAAFNAKIGGKRPSNVSQSAGNLFTSQLLQMSREYVQQKQKTAEVLYERFKNGGGRMHMYDFPDLFEKFTANNNMTFSEFQTHFEKSVQEKARRARLMNDPDSEEGKLLREQDEAQKKMEEQYLHAIEHHPESMIPVSMLYINATINGVPVKAFIDSGAQISIMSLSCAERCKLTHLVDKRFSGTLKGVGGTESSCGKIHLCDVKVENAHFLCPFTVVQRREMDLLIGLDVLRSHNCCINLAKNRLEFPDGTATPFLQSNEIDTHLKNVVGQDIDIDMACLDNEEMAGPSEQK